MSIVVMKRKSRRYTHPISSSPGGFTLNGGKQTVKSNSGRIAIMMNRHPNIVSKTKHNGEQDMYIKNVALRSRQCVKNTNLTGPITSEAHTSNIKCP